MKIEGISVKGWRSFDEVGACLNDLRKVNIIIGPNNVGKSNLSRLLRKLKEMTAQHIESERRRQPDQSMKDIYLSELPANFFKDVDMWKWRTNEIIIEVFPWREGFCWPDNFYFNKQIDGNENLSIKAKVNKGENKIYFTNCGNGEDIILKPPVYIPGENQRESFAQGKFVDAKLFVNVFWIDFLDSLVFVDPIRHYSRPHKPNETGHLMDVPKFYFNGADLIAELISLQKVDKKSWLAYKSQMEKWLKDIVDDSICNIALVEPAQYRLHFKLGEDEIVQNLGALGTGVAQIVMLLSFLHLNYAKNLNVFIDEPESNLHATAVAKLVSLFTNEFPTHNFFLATHSPAILDQVSDNWSIFRATNKPHGATKFLSCSNAVQHYKLLDDLGVRASQILQTNMVIWVEGPSDAIYLKKWIGDLSKGELTSGIHYSFLFYGGSNLSSHTLLDDDEKKYLIDMLATSRYTAIVCDSDCKSEEVYSKSEFKARVKNIFDRLAEIDVEPNDDGEKMKDFVGIWITDGREVENYVPSELFKEILFASPFKKEFIKSDDGSEKKLEIIDGNVSFGSFDSFDMAFASAYRDKDRNTISEGIIQKIAGKYSQNKVNIAKAVAEKWNEGHYDTNLRERIQSLIALIKKANAMAK